MPTPLADGRRGERSGAQAGDRRRSVAAEKEVIDPFFQWAHNDRAAGNGWNRSVNHADWGVDYYESNWLPAPEGTFSLYIRAYWGKEAILDGTWQPPKIEVIQ